MEKQREEAVPRLHGRSADGIFEKLREACVATEEKAGEGVVGVRSLSSETYTLC